MICITLLTLCLVGLVSCRRERRSDDRDLLENFSAFQSERSSSTSTSSSDSSSDATRIASAVEAALREAELHDKLIERNGGQQRGQANAFETFRLRLSTVGQPNTCGFFSCFAFQESVSIDLQGAQATVVTTEGSFTADFDDNGVATNANDMFAFTVTHTAADGEDSFVLETIVGEFGVNVSSVQIATQPQPEGRAVVFDTAVNNGFWDAQTLLNSDETLRVANSTTVIGCDQTFDGVENEGSTSFTVTLGPFADREFLVANITGNTTVSFSAGVRTVSASANNNNAVNAGLGQLPCAQRTNNVYTGVTIATKGDSSNALNHPILYDAALGAQTGGMLSFITELQQVAGRKQVFVRDVILDNGAFSPLSHKSKFTPCFRVFPEDDGGSIEVLLGVQGGAGTVRGELLVEDLLDDDNEQIDFDEDDAPEFRVEEVVFANLDIGFEDGTNTRPFTLIPSDVSITIERCPEFNYYQ